MVLESLKKILHPQNSYWKSIFYSECFFYVRDNNNKKPPKPESTYEQILESSRNVGISCLSQGLLALKIVQSKTVVHSHFCLILLLSLNTDRIQLEKATLIKY